MVYATDVRTLRALVARRGLLSMFQPVTIPVFTSLPPILIVLNGLIMGYQNYSECQGRLHALERPGISSMIPTIFVIPSRHP
jgi:hypothetical protein